MHKLLSDLVEPKARPWWKIYDYDTYFKAIDDGLNSRVACKSLFSKWTCDRLKGHWGSHSSFNIYDNLITQSWSD